MNIGILALFFFSSGCGRIWGGITFLNSPFNYTSATVFQKQSVSAATPANLTINSTGLGNLLVVGFSSASADQITSITDSASNTYVTANVRAFDAGCNCATEIWYAKNSKGGAASVTVNWAGGDPAAIWFMEVSGVDQNSPLDNGATADNSVASAFVTAPLVGTSLANEFVFSVGVVTSNSISRIDSGNSFNGLQILAYANAAAAYDVASASGNYGALWDQTLSSKSVASSASFKPGTTVGYPPTSLGFGEAPTSLNAYACTGINVMLQSLSGAPTTSSTPTTVTLSGSNLTFFSDPVCGNSISNVTIPAGTTATTFYFEAISTTSVVASASGLISGSKVLTMSGNNSLGNGWYLVQGGAGWNGVSTPALTQTTMFFQATRAGDLLVADCSQSTAGPIFTMNDNGPSGGNTYVPSNEGMFSAIGSAVEVFYVLNSKAGATALVITSNTSAAWLGCGWAEFVNTAGVSAGEEAGTGPTHGDNYATGVTAGINQVISASITTSVAGDLIYGFTKDTSGCDETIGVGFSNIGDGCNYTEAATQSSAGGINVTETVSGAGESYFIEGMAFKP